MANETKQEVHEEDWFTCSDCSESFGYASLLDEHKQRAHPTKSTEPSAREWMRMNGLISCCHSPGSITGVPTEDLLELYASYKLQIIAAEVGEEAGRECEVYSNALPEWYDAEKVRRRFAAIIQSTIERKAQ